MLFWTGYPVLSETRPPHKTSCTGPKGGLTCEVLLYTIIYIITSFHTILYANTHACAWVDPENCKGGWVGGCTVSGACFDRTSVHSNIMTSQQNGSVDY